MSITKDSIQEYSGEFSLVVYTFGCNLKCSYCHNYQHITNPDNIIKQSAIEIVRKYITPLHTALVVLGGEPTIQVDLIDFLKQVRQEFPKLKLKIFTNGTNLRTITRIVKEGLIDSISLDFKSTMDMELFGFYNQSLYTSMMYFLVDFLNKHKIKTEVRTTIYKDMDIKDIQKIQDFMSRYEDIKFIKQQEINGN